METTSEYAQVATVSVRSTSTRVAGSGTPSTTTAAERERKRWQAQREKSPTGENARNPKEIIRGENQRTTTHAQRKENIAPANFKT